MRKAKVADLKRIQELGTELMLSDKRFDPLLSEHWYFAKEGKKFLLKEIKGRGHVCFVAEIQGEIIGYASCKIPAVESWRPVKRAELNNLVVAEEYRSHGAGHKLVDAFKEWAKSKGATKVKVISHALNEDAIRFYESNGFEPFHRVMEADL